MFSFEAKRAKMALLVETTSVCPCYIVARGSTPLDPIEREILQESPSDKAINRPDIIFRCLLIEFCL